MSLHACFNPLDRGNLYQIGQNRSKHSVVVENMFQSPRSGKFVSDMYVLIFQIYNLQSCFNPLDRGNLYLITRVWDDEFFCWRWEFQSPRSGKFVSDLTKKNAYSDAITSFNPLDRGNLYQIKKD